MLILLASETASLEHEPTYYLNMVWTVGASLWIYLMHGGFGFYEAGMCRRKNTVDTLSHNLMILAVAIGVFWLVGFGVMFGAGNGFMGLTGFVPDLFSPGHADYPALATQMLPLAAAFAFALSFCDTPATLIAGTGAERIRFVAVIILAVVISGFIFPVVGHWVVGGGWLTKLSPPVYDIGSGMVHLCGGCCALAMAILLGPRTERFRQRNPYRKSTIPPSSMPLVFLGAFILWLGFFAYSAGFAMTVSQPIGVIVVNTALAGALGAVSAMTLSWVLTRRAELRATIVGLLAGNVAITSPSGVVEPWAAAVIGVAAGLLTVASIRFFAWLRIDDPTEYLTMNVVGGLLGMIAVGLFASPEIIQQFGREPKLRPGWLYSGEPGQLVSQLIGVGAIAAFSLAAGLIVCVLLKGLGVLRVPLSEEEAGSDVKTHGEEAYEQYDAEKEDHDERGEG